MPDNIGNTNVIGAPNMLPWTTFMPQARPSTIAKIKWWQSLNTLKKNF